MQRLDPHRLRGVLLFARRPSVGGCGSPPRELRYLREEGRERGGAWGHGVHVRGGGGSGLVGWRVRQGDEGAAERHHAADRADEWPQLAKVGRGARGARGVGGAAVSSGARAPLGGDQSRRASSTGASPCGGGGERHAVPSRPNRTRTGPAGWIPGGRAGLHTGAPGPGYLVVVGRCGGDRAGPWAAAGEGGVEGPGRLGGEPREAPGGWARAPESARSLRGGGGGCSLPGRRVPLLSEGGGGRVSPGVGPCQFIVVQHGTISPTLRAGVPFFRGGLGGGGAGGCCVHPPMLGGVAGGSRDRHARKNPVASPGREGPLRGSTSDSRGGLCYTV